VPSYQEIKTIFKSKASVARLFLEDDNIFRKSASVVQLGIAVEFVPQRPIFEKCSPLREKRGVAAKNTANHQNIFQLAHLIKDTVHLKMRVYTFVLEY
jgi:hypothetical protein